MKVSEFRTLIREQIKKTLREEEEAKPEEGGSMSMTDLGNKFLQISKDLKGSQIKGLSSGEMKALSALLDKIMTDSSAGEETNTLKRMAKL